MPEKQCPEGTKLVGKVCMPDLKWAYDPAKMNPNSYGPYFYIPSANLKVSMNINLDPKKKEISITNVKVEPYTLKTK
jgi:hypothetical protein